MEFRFSKYNGRSNRLPIAVYVPGILFIVFGVMIMMFPMLLVAIITSIFIIIGAVLLAIPWKLRKAKKDTDAEGYYTLRFGDCRL